AIAIAYKAIQNGFESLFVGANALLERLSLASADGELRDVLPEYVHPHVLVIDEVGYLLHRPDAANVLFHVVNERHLRRRSVILTTNKPTASWGHVLHDADLAEAILDRVLERGRTIELRGASYRTRHLAAEPRSRRRSLLDDDATASTQLTRGRSETDRISGIDLPSIAEPTLGESEELVVRKIVPPFSRRTADVRFRQETKGARRNAKPRATAKPSRPASSVQEADPWKSAPIRVGARAARADPRSR